MDGPLKNQVLDLCASSASFLEKKKKLSQFPDLFVPQAQSPYSMSV